jgi:hypothetical protein
LAFAQLAQGQSAHKFEKLMTDLDKQLFWVRIFFNGGGVVLAIIFIALACSKEARGVFKLLLWGAAILLLLMEAGCWMLGAKVGNATQG